MFSTIDPLGRQIELTEACYLDHILVEHPEMSDVGEIEATIRRPEMIAEDVIDSNRLIYYRTVQRRPQFSMIKVVVEWGEVVTAYRVKRLKFGERLLWQR